MNRINLILVIAVGVGITIALGRVILRKRVIGPSKSVSHVHSSQSVEKLIMVGNPTTLEGYSPTQSYSVVFEDDGETGYLYGLNLSNRDNPIVDALHIYNVAGVADRAKPSVAELVWSTDGLKAQLLINHYPHAIFDFASKRGYCRTGFPPPNRNWTEHGHEWSDDAQALFP